MCRELDLVDIQTEAERMGCVVIPIKEYERLVTALADLLFAYKNKDEFPHEFEKEAVNNAVDILLKEYVGDKYSKEFFENCRV